MLQKLKTLSTKIMQSMKEKSKRLKNNVVKSISLKQHNKICTFYDKVSEKISDARDLCSDFYERKSRTFHRNIKKVDAGLEIISKRVFKTENLKRLIRRLMNRTEHLKKVYIISQVRKSRKIRTCFKDEYLRLTGENLTDEMMNNKLNVAVKLRFKGVKKPMDLFRTVRVFEYTLRSYGLDIEGALHRAYKCFNLSKVYTKRDLLQNDDETKEQLLNRNIKKLVDKELSMDSKYQREVKQINDEYTSKIAANPDIENTWKLKNEMKEKMNILYNEYFQKYESYVLIPAHKITNYDMTSLKIMLGLNE